MATVLAFGAHADLDFLKYSNPSKTQYALGPGEGGPTCYHGDPAEVAVPADCHMHRRSRTYDSPDNTIWRGEMGCLLRSC